MSNVRWRIKIMKIKTHSFFKKSDVQIVVKYTYVSFLKIASRTHETEKLCLQTYLLKSNQVWQNVKSMILST